MRENTKGIRWKISPVVRSDTLLFLLEERFDLLESFLVLRDVKVFLDDSNEHVQNDDCETGQFGTQILRLRCHPQLAKMNHNMQNAAPIHAVLNLFWKAVTLYKIAVQFSLDKIWYMPRNEL